jgi:16S rRNA (guanine527-N7)-methyltransferase
MTTLASELAHGIEALGLPIESAVQTKLLQYVALIERWNRVYNLTAVREPEKMLTHHVLDCLAVAPHVTGGSLLDVGSGAGLPGIPLALVHPAHRVTLLDSSHTKASFLKQAAIELSLPNVEAVHARVETWEGPGPYDFVISRAFSDLAEFVSLAGRVCAPGGTLAAMKGVYPYEELALLPAGYRLAKAVPLAVPGLSAERHLMLIERAGE